jgi:hypothetical protein
MRMSINPKKLVLTFIIVSVVLTILSLVGILDTWDDRFLVFRILFELNEHITVGTWFASFQFLISMIFAGLVAWDHTQRQQTFARHWGYLAIVFMLMSMDEFTNWHSEILSVVGELMGGGDGVFHYAWVIPGLIIVAGFFVVFTPFFLRLPRTPQLGIAGGLAIFVAGAVGFEMLTGWMFANVDMTPWQVRLLNNAEEFTEMIGMCFVIWGLAHYIRDYTVISLRLETRPEGESTRQETG